MKQVLWQSFKWHVVLTFSFFDFFNAVAFTFHISPFTFHLSPFTGAKDDVLVTIQL